MLRSDIKYDRDCYVCCKTYLENKNVIIFYSAKNWCCDKSVELYIDNINKVGRLKSPLMISKYSNLVIKRCLVESCSVK